MIPGWLTFRQSGMCLSFIAIAGLCWFAWDFSDGLTGKGLLFMVYGISAGCVLFVIECLDFWRVFGSKAGCGCCERVAEKTACLTRFQQNLFYRSVLYISAGIGALVVNAVFSGGTWWADASYVLVILAGVLYLVAWRKNEHVLGRDEYAGLLGAGEAVAKSAAQDAAIAHATHAAQNATAEDVASMAGAFKDVAFDEHGEVAYDPSTMGGAASLV